eukprot:573147-Pelagomonas_calceolata.AAC.6
MAAHIQSHCLPAIPHFLLPWAETRAKSHGGPASLAFQRDGCGNFERGSRSLLLCNITSPATNQALRRGQGSKRSTQGQGQGQQEPPQDTAALQTDEMAGGEEEVPSDEGLLLPDEDVAPRRISRNFK